MVLKVKDEWLRLWAAPAVENITEWTQEGCTEVGTMTWASLASSSGRVNWGPLHKTPVYELQHMRTQTVHHAFLKTPHTKHRSDLSYKWLGNKRRKGRKEREEWSLSLSTSGRSPGPSSSSLKCEVCGKNFYHISGPVKGQLSFATVTTWTTCKKWAWLTLALTLYLLFFG